MFASLALAAAITTAPADNATTPRPEFQKMVNELKIELDDILRENDAIVAKTLNS